MIPDTINGLPAMACVFAMQKCIRRGMEREAMEFAVELMHTSKAFPLLPSERVFLNIGQSTQLRERTVL